MRHLQFQEAAVFEPYGLGILNLHIDRRAAPAFAYKAGGDHVPLIKVLTADHPEGFVRSLLASTA